MNSLLGDLAQQAIWAAEEEGAREVEVFGLLGRSIHVDIQLNKIELARESLTRGLGIKAIVRGAVGFSSTNDPGRIKDAAAAAVRSAKVRGNDPDWSGLPGPAHYKKAVGIHDPRVARLDIDACIDHSMAMINGVGSIAGAMPTSGKFICSNTTYIIMNSSGLEVKEDTTRVEGFIDCRYDQSTAFEFGISRHLDLDFYQIGKEAARQAAASSGGGSIASGEMDVLFKPTAIADILENTLLPSLSAENVQKNRSALIGKVGSQIGNDDLNIMDDGLLEGGIGSARSDDEGTPSRKNVILENGVLNSFLYDKYAAGKDGVESTGNAVRNNYAQTTFIDVRNLKLDFPASDVVGDTGRGVLVGSVIGAHTANPISGDFSVEARNSFLIEDGRCVRPIRSMMVSGNVFKMLQSISGAGRDTRVLGNIIAPTIRISRLDVTG